MHHGDNRRATKEELIALQTNGVGNAPKPSPPPDPGEYIRQRCPLCGGRKNDSKYALCFEDHKAYLAGVARHNAVLQLMGNTAVVDAIMAGTIDPGLVNTPTEQAYALGVVLASMGRYEEELGDAEVGYAVVGRAIEDLVAQKTGGNRLPPDIFNPLKERCRALIWEKMSGAKDKYFQMLALRNRVAAAKLLIRDSDVKPQGFLEPPDSIVSVIAETAMATTDTVPA